jgi:hypothetical protein
VSIPVRARRLDTSGSANVFADAAGFYQFTGLVPGQYIIEPGITSGVITTPHGRRGYLVTVTGEEADFAGLNFGFHAGNGGMLRGTVYQDLNGNGRRDLATEPGVSARTVYVDTNDNGVRDPDEPTTQTLSEGVWFIARLPAGNYRVRQVLQPGWVQTFPVGGDDVGRVVELADGQQVTGLDFGTNRAAASVVARRPFYNNSVFDDRNSAGGPGDDAAIATDKEALVPGGIASFANVTGYALGINGVYLDVAGLSPGSTLTVADFEFSVGSAALGWVPAAAPTTVLVRKGAGVRGTDRVVLVWPDFAIRNTWLRQTMRANDRTGLWTPDVSYVGNLIGETGDGGTLRVSALDLSAVKRAFNTESPVTSRFDFNRDGRVNALDLSAVRANLNRTLAPITAAPSAPSAAAALSAAVRPASLAVQRVWDEPERTVLGG